MKTTLKTVITIALLLTITASIWACSGSETTTTTTTTTATTTTSTTTTSSTVTTISTSPLLTEAEVRAFADPVATSMMEALTEGNYDKYIADANAGFKAALTAEAFATASTQMKSQVGEFVSVTYKGWEIVEGYIRVHYDAEFTITPVPLLMVFDQDHLVAGQFFQ
ncbi:MAG: DUF3887 domain-containing protein [Dehalococcoidales bacterium]|nr:DUF3887 domain-containing protein [Dehalococcoidales bacterium]